MTFQRNRKCNMISRLLPSGTSAILSSLQGRFIARMEKKWRDCSYITLLHQFPLIPRQRSCSWLETPTKMTSVKKRGHWDMCRITINFGNKHFLRKEWVPHVWSVWESWGYTMERITPRNVQRDQTNGMFSILPRHKTLAIRFCILTDASHRSRPLPSPGMLLVTLGCLYTLG